MKNIHQIINASNNDTNSQYQYKGVNYSIINNTDPNKPSELHLGDFKSLYFLPNTTEAEMTTIAENLINKIIKAIEAYPNYTLKED